MKNHVYIFLIILFSIFGAVSSLVLILYWETKHVEELERRREEDKSP